MTQAPYMLTLCRLASPVSVRFPDDSPLRQFKFFMTRANEGNEAERLRLHMGYFASLAEAERWAVALRPRYPAAVAALVPDSVLQQSNSGVPVLRAANVPAPRNAVGSPDAVTNAETLTDTQVLRVLDGRQHELTQSGSEAQHAAIALLGPEDTSSRRALKEAVTHGAPVSFAVQLLWSVTDIDLGKLPSISIFRAYTLYKVTTTRDGRTWHCLRLGFFKDAISAKQVAYYVRSQFKSVAVVPVTESEQAESAACRINPADLADHFQRGIDEALAAGPVRDTPTKQASSTPRKESKDSLDQTLEMLAATEMWNDPESHSETGVRHLKFEVRKTSSG